MPNTKSYLTDEEIDRHISEGDDHAKVLGDAIKRFKKRNPEVGVWLYVKRLGLGGGIIALPFIGDWFNPLNRINRISGGDKQPEIILTSGDEFEHVEEDIDEIRALIRSELDNLADDIDSDHEALERLLQKVWERLPPPYPPMKK